jgi:hypothetical protein
VDWSIEVGPTTSVDDRRGLFLRLELQKGGYAGSRRRTVIGLDHGLGPTPRKCGREQLPSCAARL